MDFDEDPITCSPSTTWEWKRVKIARAPQANVTSERSEHRILSLLPWPRRKPLTLTWKYRGGPEAWVEIRARGRTFRVPGDVAIYDVMRTIHQWWDV